MSRFQNSSRVLFRYLLAVLSIAATTLAMLFLRNALSTPLVALLYLLPVGLSAAYGGLGSGILSALCAFLSFNYFFILPYYTLAVHQTNDVFVLIIFFVVAVAISQLMGRAQAGMEAASARRISRTSCAVNAGGFSQNTCLPASNAAMVKGLFM